MPPRKRPLRAYAHRAEPVYAIDRCYASIEHDNYRLGNIIVKLKPRIEKRFYSLLRDPRKTKGIHSETMNRLMAVFSPDDLADRLYEYLYKDDFRRLALYDEALLKSDFKKRTPGAASTSGLEAFCKQLVSPSSDVAAAVAGHLSPETINLCSAIFRKEVTKQRAKASLQHTLLNMITRLLQDPALVSLWSLASKDSKKIDTKIARYQQLKKEERYALHCAILSALFPRIFITSPFKPDHTINLDSVSLDALCIGLAFNSTRFYNFFKELVTSEEGEAIERYASLPGVQKTMVPDLVSAEISQILNRNVCLEEAVFEPYRSANEYNASLIDELASCVHEGTRNRLRLHLNRSIFEAAFNKEVIDSQKKFEKYIDFQIGFLWQSLITQNTIKQNRVTVSSDDSTFLLEDRPVPKNPLEAAMDLIDSYELDADARRILVYKYILNLTDSAIADRLQNESTSKNKWNRERVVKEKKLALDAIRQQLAYGRPSDSARTTLRHFEEEIPVLAIDCITFDSTTGKESAQSNTVFILSGYNYEGRRIVLSYHQYAHIADVFAWLKAQGTRGVRLVISDYCEGLRTQLSLAFPNAKWQLSYFHVKQRYSHQRALLNACKKIKASETYEQASENLNMLYKMNGHSAGLALDILKHTLTVFNLKKKEKNNPDSFTPLSKRERGRFRSTPFCDEVAALVSAYSGDREIMMNQLDLWVRSRTLQSQTSRRTILPW